MTTAAGRGWLLVGLLVAFGAAACVSSAGTPAPPSGFPTGGSLAPEACPIAISPGPDDAPPDGGEMDTSDQGGGRAATCLIGPPAVTWEETAWCSWTPDRLAVEAITGLPTTAVGDDGTWDVFLDQRASAIQVARAAPDGTVVTWTQSSVTAVIRDDGTDGLATFDAVLAPGGGSPPPATPPRVGGIMRWQCAGPPPA